MTKYILAAGCSYTDNNYTPKYDESLDVSFDKWPTILAEKLKLAVKNVGKSGVSNTYIYNQVIDEIIRNGSMIDTIAIGWSEWHRYNIYGNWHMNPVGVIEIDAGVAMECGHKQHKKSSWEKSYQYAGLNLAKHLFENKYFTNPKSKDNIFYCATREHFKQIIHIQKLCEIFNIKLLMSSLCGAYNASYPKICEVLGLDARTLKKLANWKHVVFAHKNEDFMKINSDSIIGWPWLYKLGGFEINHHIMQKEHQIGNGDEHPNKLGHEMIAELYYEKYKEIYV